MARTPIAGTAPQLSPERGGGFAAAIAAFVMWGLFPLYLIGLLHVSAMQITAHRIVWSCVFVLGWLALRRELGGLWGAVTRDGVLIRLTASAFFIAINWLGFAWAVNHDHVLEVSLAYFMGPLLNVLLGIFVLSERLDRTQWIAVAFAAAGVAYLTFIADHTPWIALMVGSSFAIYGLIRKTVHIDALPGLAVETILLAPFAVGYLIWCEAQGSGVLGHASATVTALLLLRRSRHLDSTVSLLVWRPAGSVFHDRRAAVHRPDHAARRWAARVRRAVRTGSRHRVRAHLDRVIDLRRKRFVEVAVAQGRCDLTSRAGQSAPDGNCTYARTGNVAPPRHAMGTA